MAARGRQGLSRPLQGSGRLLDRQQPVHQHAGLQHRAGPEGHASRRPIRICSIRNGAARSPGTALPSTSGGVGFVGTVLAEMGEEKGMAYLRELRQAEGRQCGGSAREVLDQVIAGEYPIALQIFNHHAVISAKKGAPVDWIKMEPATGTLSVLVDPQERAASQRRQAAGRFHHLQGRPGGLPRRRLHHRRSGGPGARSRAQARGRPFPRALLHARDDREQHAEMEADFR